MRDDAFYVSLYTHSEEYSNFITLFSLYLKTISCAVFSAVFTSQFGHSN
jgi:hypothetical protein